MSTPATPLAGLRVLELARILAGPWAGQLMADLGASVLKVERKGAGDDTREWGPPFVASAPESGLPNLDAAYFHACNRGKRSFAANFADPADLAVIRRLATAADVVIENFKPGALRKFGLDAQSLRAAKPSLIVCSITGFGQDGPYAHRAGYEVLIQGMAGAMSVTGEAGGRPLKTGYATADLFTGLYATIGILSALRRRDATGEGAHVDCALMDSQVSVLCNQAMNYLVSGIVPGARGNAHPNIVPYESFPARDGTFLIASGNDSQFKKLCEVLGGGDLAADPNYATNALRVQNRERLVAELSKRTRALPLAGILASLEAAGVPAGPVNSIDAVFADPQVRARGLQIASASEWAQGGAIPGLRTPLVIDGARVGTKRAAPRLGEHDAEILADPDWTDPRR